MRFSNKTEYKDKIITKIKEFFDKNEIEAIAKDTGFVERE